MPMRLYLYVSIFSNKTCATIVLDGYGPNVILLNKNAVEYVNKIAEDVGV